jgi:opacity protein-like surface antigen
MAVRPIAASASILALITAAPAAAQDFYVGFGLEYGDTEMTDAIPVDYSGDLTMGSLFGGVRVPANNFFFGAEAETSLFTDYSTSSFTGDDIDRISRLRALGGYDWGAFAAFAAAGGAWVEGELSGPGLDDSANGWTYGLGGEYTINDRFDVRLEVIHDDVEFENGSYSWENTSLRAGAIVKF